MSTTRVNEKPSFAEIDDPGEKEKLQKEIQKIKPPIEISIEGFSEVAKGRIMDWNAQRKLFTVAWSKKSEKFDEMTDKQTGLRAFCKSQLFSTQLIFKTTTVRHLDDGTYHYRIPTQWFKQQRRGALRVPIHHGTALSLDGYKIKAEDFRATVTFRGDHEIGVRFSGLNEALKTEIKHYLIEALRIHYEKEY
jgi:hypothetical protein